MGHNRNKNLGSGKSISALPELTLPLLRSTKTRAKAKQIYGFTLIELMLAIGIVGILASIGLPSMNYIMNNSRVRTATSDAHISLLLARSEAIKRNVNINLVRSGANWTNGWTVVIASDSTLLGTQDALGDVVTQCFTTSDASTTCGNTLTFQRTGRATSYIEYRFYNSSSNSIPMRCVRVSLSGRPGVTVDSNSNPADGCN